jgi:hypothetical protein
MLRSKILIFFLPHIHIYGGSIEVKNAKFFTFIMKKRMRPGENNILLPSSAKKKTKKKGKRIGGKRKRIWGRGTNTANRDRLDTDTGMDVFSPTLAGEGKGALEAIYHRRDLVRERMKQIVVQKTAVKVRYERRAR